MSLYETSELQRQSSLNAMKRIECSYKMIVQLQKLFVTLTKSEKKYADPTAMIRNIVDDFGNQLKIGDQQDISEVSEGFMSRVHEGVQAMLDPYGENDNDMPFGENDEDEEKSEGEGKDSEESSESDTEDLLDKIEKIAKQQKSNGYIKDFYYGMQVETTENSLEKGSERLQESEFLMILLNIEVILTFHQKILVSFIQNLKNKN